jgi:DNA-binding MarR family transcriptional regulator
MQMEEIILLYSNGAPIRRKILQLFHTKEKDSWPLCLTSVAGQFDISKVAIKRHVDLLLENGYLEKINPAGKPVYLKLTSKGTETARKYIFY